MHKAQPHGTFHHHASVDTSRWSHAIKPILHPKSEYGQYMTPATVASFMASLFPHPTTKVVRLLDPGAGSGSLSSAFISKVTSCPAGPDIVIDAYEIDSRMCEFLEKTLMQRTGGAENYRGNISWRIHNSDFVTEAANQIASINGLWGSNITKYTHCIMNPPYKKISSKSLHRRSLRLVEIETVNYYAAFVALSLMMMEPGGWIVAIIPRSFCNGTYYRPFRKFLLKHSAIHCIHLFNRRDKVFKDDNVLQENIILVLERDGKQGDVKITTSADDDISKVTTNNYCFDQIIRPGDSGHFIHIPTLSESNILEASKSIRFSLRDTGIQVSTGPIVDFRLKDYLRKMPEVGSVPLLYPSHFSRQVVVWPRKEGRKPNAIKLTDATQKYLYPRGYYTVVRRFTSKEEKRRIVASVVAPKDVQDAKHFGFENHLNVFHEGRRGLSKSLAYGLAVFLNSTAFDISFRQFSGHTQVNVTDLEGMKYPSRADLVSLGIWASKYTRLTQPLIDERIGQIA